MSAKDRFHQAVKQALIQEGWNIADDPLLVRYGPTNLKVDLGAERIIAAQRDAEQIAVKIKSFLDASTVNDFHAAIGQYLHYQLEVYRAEFDKPLYQDSIQTFDVKILVYRTENPGIEQWIE